MLASSADCSHGGQGGASGVFRTSDDKYIEIREVWAYNLEEEIEKICEVIQKYPYVAMVIRKKHTIFSDVFLIHRTANQYHRTQNFLVLLLVLLVITGLTICNIRLLICSF